MKRQLRKLALRAAGLVPPCIAEHAITALEHRLGIGSGGGVDESGEAAVFRVLESIAPDSPVIFDVGANQGQYTSELLTRLGPDKNFTIHCFEPSPATFKILTGNHGGNPRAVLNNFGLSKEPGRSVLYMDAEGSGLASLTERRLGHFGIPHGSIREEVELRTLETYCRENQIPRIHLLKIDVEGHELDVIAGSGSLFAEQRIDLVQFEFGGCNIDTRTFYQDFFYFFADAGFELFRILPGNKLLPLPHYRESDEKFRTSNFLAARRPLEIARKCGNIII